MNIIDFEEEKKKRIRAGLEYKGPPRGPESEIDLDMRMSVEYPVNPGDCVVVWFDQEITFHAGDSLTLEMPFRQDELEIEVELEEDHTKDSYSYTIPNSDILSLLDMDKLPPKVAEWVRTQLEEEPYE